MFGNSLADELEALEMNLSFTRDGVCAVLLSAIESSWLPPERKRALAETFRSDPVFGESPAIRI